MKLRRGPARLASLRVSQTLANRNAPRSGLRRDRRYCAALLAHLMARPGRIPTFELRPRAARLLTVWDAALNTAHEEPVAQLVEHLTFNQVVQGSSPCGLTNNLSMVGEEVR